MPLLGRDQDGEAWSRDRVSDHERSSRGGASRVRGKRRRHDQAGRLGRGRCHFLLWFMHARQQGGAVAAQVAMTDRSFAQAWRLAAQAVLPHHGRHLSSQRAGLVDGSGHWHSKSAKAPWPLLLCVGVVVIGVGVVVVDWTAPPEGGLEHGSSSTHRDPGHTDSDLSNLDLLQPAEVAAEGLSRVENTTDDSQALTPAVSLSRFSEDDVLALREHLDLLYANATAEEVRAGLADVLARIPPGYADSAHKRLLEAGEYEVVGQASTTGDSVTIPTRSIPDDVVYGRYRITKLEDGRLVRTKAALGDLGSAVQLGVEASWFAERLKRIRK